LGAIPGVFLCGPPLTGSVSALLKRSLVLKYHIALSCAGEDRAYVEKVALQLQAEGVDVFYDGFEEADL
jgi:hypothetical protein